MVHVGCEKQKKNRKLLKGNKTSDKNREIFPTPKYRHLLESHGTVFVGTVPHSEEGNLGV